MHTSASRGEVPVAGLPTCWRAGEEPLTPGSTSGEGRPAQRGQGMQGWAVQLWPACRARLLRRHEDAVRDHAEATCGHQPHLRAVVPPTRAAEHAATRDRMASARAQTQPFLGRDQQAKRLAAPWCRDAVPAGQEGLAWCVALHKLAALQCRKTAQRAYLRNSDPALSAPPPPHGCAAI